jgi:prepilin-type N-terminal cleavage/methylation domain-containing protein
MRWHLQRIKSIDGFTIVELLIVIVVIGILAAIAVTNYSGTQQRVKNVQAQNDLIKLQNLVEVYHSEHGSYPITTPNPKANWHAADARTDANCTNGSSDEDWIPDLDEDLPQSDPDLKTGVDGIKGCFIYVSEGTEYVISAWNMVSTPQSTSLYRRLGFRQFQSESSTQFYTCNQNNVGGVSGGDYDISQDYYKHSYTISNITDCDETPPAGG